MPSLETVLSQRGNNYGDFTKQATCSRLLKTVLINAPGWQTMTSPQREGLEMIAVKLSRIVSGNPNWVDSWIDIAGYATLVADSIQKGAPNVQLDEQRPGTLRQ